MEYTYIIQPIAVIFVSFGIGVTLGSFWMFWLLSTENSNIKKELDSKNRLLDTYENIYEDDNYEAY